MLDKPKNSSMPTNNQIPCLLFISMLYTAVMIANAVLTKKWIALGSYFVFGGAFISPFLFILGDIIAELFGYNLTKKVILFGFICQTIFAIIVQAMIQTPSPLTWNEEHSYSFVFNSMIRIDLSGFFAYFLSCLINAKLLTRWKVILHGQYFGLRSIGASTISEACYSGIAILMIGFGTLPFSSMLSVIALSYAIKIIFSIIFSYPANILVNYIKFRYKFDEPDTITFDPFSNKVALN